MSNANPFDAASDHFSPTSVPAYRASLLKSVRVPTTELKAGDVVHYHGIKISIDSVIAHAKEDIPGGVVVVASGPVVNADEVAQGEGYLFAEARWLLDHRSDEEARAGRKSIKGSVMALWDVQR